MIQRIKLDEGGRALQEQLRGFGVTVRVFRVSMGGAASRTVRMLHKNDWMDGQPVAADALNALADAVDVVDAGAAGPMIGHCCGGVGRIGTFFEAYKARRRADAAVRAREIPAPPAWQEQLHDSWVRGRKERNMSLWVSSGQQYETVARATGAYLSRGLG